MIGAAMRRQFLADYARIRAAEGRGADTSAYYRSLPFADLTGRNSGQWRIRARTFEYFLRHIIPRGACRILDLGAGNCWLTYHLMLLGHSVVALDIFADERDGLRARRHYPVEVRAVEADFNTLPFNNSSFDLLIFNSSIHYSSDYVQTLHEARRCLRPGGRVVILDSPVYRRCEHGEAMRAERQLDFERRFGGRSAALGSIEYFDLETLRTLASRLSIRWKIHRPWYGFRWHLRPAIALLKRRRPPSRFWILEAAFQ
ncbi:MAG: class I SAM-dependent methyltransferase [Bryobacterales bacterium]|nr:class I SAM-dependent methyltransferase [Bryobacterales bacterium]MBV9398245.1 class I SAM-dependent methyltransferase [Bryobacterales bacterium]